MKIIDMRFDADIMQKWIGKTFVKYKCDAFNYTNSVTQIVGLYIGDDVFALTNIQEVVDYFGFVEDMSVSRITKVEESAIKSAFKNVEMISTPVGGQIDSITIVNEQQKMAINGKSAYEVWLTRAIIFDVAGHEILFEKDIVPFSEEITIQRGYNLLDKISDNDDFLEEWDDEYTPEYAREVIEIK